MSPRKLLRSLGAILALAGFLNSGSASSAQVLVRQKEGLVHGFLVLRTLDGELIANGDSTEIPHGNRVTNRLVFHFKDGSLHDVTAVFSQGTHFKLLSCHLIQKGPSFPHALDVTTDVVHGAVTVRYSDDKGKEQIIAQHMDLPEDISNGLVLTLLKNITATTSDTTVSMVVATPKPRVVKLVITPQGEDTFSTGTISRKAIHYVVHVHIGGAAGLAAPLLGKQPHDTQVWVLGGDAPAFIRSEGPMYSGGPIWRTETVSPVWH